MAEADTPFQDEKTKLDELDIKKLNGTPEELDIITNVFNTRINSIIQFGRQKNPDAQEFVLLDSVVKETEVADQTLIIEKCKDKIWGSREYIKERNEQYFLARDYGNLIKKDHNQELIQMLVNLVKGGWQTLYIEEKYVLWQKTRTMLKAVIYYAKWKRVTSSE